MTNTVTIKHQVLTERTLNDLYLYTRDGKQPSRTNFFGWDQTVIGVSNAIFFFTLPDDLKNKVIEELLEKKVLPARPKLMSANVALYSRNSFIPWHNDSSHSYSATVYLNKEWNKDWGGYLAYQEEGSEIKCFIPAYNSCVCYPTPLMHSVQLTALNAPMRESLQIFVDEF